MGHYNVSFTEDELALVVTSLMLRGISRTFHTQKDEKTAKELANRLNALFNLKEATPLGRYLPGGADEKIC